MSDQSVPPQFVEDVPIVRPQNRNASTYTPERNGVSKTPEKSISFWQSIDKSILTIVGILLALGVVMVYSTTFDWSFSEWGNPTVKVIEHARNVAVGLAAMVVTVIFDYRRVRRIAVPLLLVSIGSLIAVLLFADVTFGARRALIGGRFQPGELAELAMVIYMAAWLSSKSTRIRSLTYGLTPFAILVGIVCGLVALQPDLSTALVIVVVCGSMFFLAGADIVQLAVGAAIVVAMGIALVLSGEFIYAEGRIGSFLAGWGDITQADYHVQQAFIAFDNGGWFGVGLGEGAQKFTGLPAPHTDSIFAVIGEELGIFGAGIVVLLFVVLVTRGFNISRRATDPFAALLAAGVTLWIVSKALLNIAVMLALVPPTGVSLPFISFGGSSLVTLLIGVGLLLSVQRVNMLKETTPERRDNSANYDRRRRDRRARVSRASRSGSTSRTASHD